jgi:translation initiation factor 3 subunit G
VTEIPRAEGGTGKYVPPSRREGFSGSTMMQTDTHPSIRVSNLPTDVKEDDLRELFETFGRIKKVYLGKDKKTGDFKVSF